MTSPTGQHNQQHLDTVALFALGVLPANEISGAKAQIFECSECAQEFQRLQPIVESLVSWPTNILRPSAPLWDRLTRRVAAEAGTEPLLDPSSNRGPEWEEAAPGIFVKILANDFQNNRVSMLVRLAPGTDYPAHCHADVEELHLLDGELFVDERKLYPGDYIYAKAGTVDHRVWSETGCTCVLMTSAKDEIL